MRWSILRQEPEVCEEEFLILGCVNNLGGEATRSMILDTIIGKHMPDVHGLWVSDHPIEHYFQRWVLNLNLKKLLAEKRCPSGFHMSYTLTDRGKMLIYMRPRAAHRMTIHITLMGRNHSELQV